MLKVVSGVIVGIALTLFFTWPRPAPVPTPINEPQQASTRAPEPSTSPIRPVPSTQAATAAQVPDLEPMRRAAAEHLQRALSRDPALRQRIQDTANAHRSTNVTETAGPDAAQAVAPMLQESLGRLLSQPEVSVELKAALDDAVNRPDEKGESR